MWTVRQQYLSGLHFSAIPGLYVWRLGTGRAQAERERGGYVGAKGPVWWESCPQSLWPAPLLSWVKRAAQWVLTPRAACQTDTLRPGEDPG